MLKIGRMNTLTALRRTSVGMFLGDPTSDPEDATDILLPNKYVPESLRTEDEIEVFVYRDSEDRLIATTLVPHIQRGEFAALQAVSVMNFGAFMDWGLEKDLLVPHKEQSRPMRVGRWYVVYLYLDEQTDRLVASSKINKFVNDRAFDLEVGQEVDLLVYEPTDLGFNAIVDNRYRGLLYANELFQKVFPGDRLVGYVKTIREDNRIDITLQKPGYQNVEPNADRIVQVLQQAGGFLPLTDNSDPKLIYDQLEMSKKTFKKAIGALYRDRKIELKPDGIYLTGASK